MSQKTIILTVILFALIVLGMFTYARLRSIELDSSVSIMEAVYSEVEWLL